VAGGELGIIGAEEVEVAALVGLEDGAEVEVEVAAGAAGVGWGGLPEGAAAGELGVGEVEGEGAVGDVEGDLVAGLDQG